MAPERPPCLSPRRVLCTHCSCRPYPHIRSKLCCSVFSCFSRALWFDRGLCWLWGQMPLAHLPRLMALPSYTRVCVWFGLCYALSRVTLAFSAFGSPLPRPRPHLPPPPSLDGIISAAKANFLRKSCWGAAGKPCIPERRSWPFMEVIRKMNKA